MKKRILIYALAAVVGFGSGLAARAAAIEHETGEAKIFVSMVDYEMAE